MHQNNFAYFHLRRPQPMYDKRFCYSRYTFHRFGSIFLRRDRAAGLCYATYAIAGYGDTFDASFSWNLTQRRMLNNEYTVFKDSFLTTNVGDRIESSHLADFLSKFNVDRLRALPPSHLTASTAAFAGALLHLGYRQKEVQCPLNTLPSAT